MTSDQFDHLDYFFEPYITPQEKRLSFVARNGVAHASVIKPNDPDPGQPVTLSIITDATLPIERVAVYYTTDGREPRGAYGVAQVGVVALAGWLEDADDEPALDGNTNGRQWRVALPGQPDGTLVRYRIDAWNSADASRHWFADAEDPSAAPAPEGRLFAYHVDRRKAPEWVQDAVIYQIFVDRFASASGQQPLRPTGKITDFYGGSIRGITEKLDYLASLGVTCLWLSPIMESPTYHSYNPSSFFRVSERFGSNDDLRELIAACHARGMRILLDFVANHTSNEHPAFLAAREHAPAVRDWYIFGPDYPNGYLTYYQVKGMPVLNTEAPVVRDYLSAAARHWLTELGADGLRLDNVSGPTLGFWTLFQESVKQAAPDALTLSEVSGGLTDLRAFAGRTDASMDFPLAKEMRRVFALHDAPLSELLGMLEQHEAALPDRMTPARILDNHDMTRFLWLAENDTRRLKLALAFLMSLTGVPIVYYGTEVGLSQREGPARQDAYSREPMPWGSGQQADVLEYTRWLIHQRRQRVSLRRGQMAQVEALKLDDLMGNAADDAAADQAGQLGALARWYGDEATLLVVNNSVSPVRFAIDTAALPFTLAPDAPAQGYRLAPDGITPLGELSPARLASELPPLSAALLFLGTERGHV